MPRTFRLLAAVALASISGYGGLTAGRLAWAERLSQRDTVESLEHASRIAPDNAAYYARIATLDPVREDDLRTALRHNPRDPSSWILRSVREEEDGDIAAAEQSLLRANEVARYYKPRWSLAAFYFRQSNRTKFAGAARGALSVGYGDADSLFRMAQRLGFTSDEILNKIIPGDPSKLESYLRLALRDSDLDAAGAATVRLLAVGSAQQLDASLAVCDALFSSGRIDRAVQIWNKLAEAKWIQHRRLDPSAGVSLATDRFGLDALGRGFDWSFPDTPGVARSEDQTGLSLEFSGQQPEKCDLVRQRIVPAVDRRYRLTVRYRVENIAAGAGLSVAVRPLAGGSSAFSAILMSDSSDWHNEAFEFQSPRQPAPLELALVYTRSLGTTRIEGRLWIESIQLQRID